MRVLVTRPRAEAEATAAALAAMGHEAVVDPIVEIVPHALPPIDPASTAAIIVTSPRAAAAIPAGLRHLPVFAVGGATARAAKLAGCGHVCVGPGEGIGLAGQIASSVPSGVGRLLHLSGEEVRPGLAEALRATGHRYERVIAYTAKPTSAPSPAVRRELGSGRIDAMLLYSPRSAFLWAANATAGGGRDIVRHVIACCLSPAVAAPLVGIPFPEIRVAASRNEQALLACLATPSR